MEDHGITLTSFDEVLEERIKKICSKMFDENIHAIKQNIKELLISCALTIKEVAQILGKDEKTIRSYGNKGLKSYSIGRTRVYFEDDVLAFIESNNRVKNG